VPALFIEESDQALLMFLRGFREGQNLNANEDLKWLQELRFKEL
jgi:hypothetical protein